MALETLLVVAHPGHEARLHGWLERTQPWVCILTDGSGRAGQPRLEAAKQYLAGLGARRGPIFGRYREQEFYRLLLARDFDPLVALAVELADTMVAEGVRCVVGDASEGYSSTHDAGHLITGAAVEMARRAGGQIESYDFPVMHRPDRCPPGLRDRAVWLHLDEPAFARKMSAAACFYPELAAEVREAFRAGTDHQAGDYFPSATGGQSATTLDGMDAFRVECLRPVLEGAAPFETERPFYEVHGERQVTAGHYPEVIRYREHLLPLAGALRDAVGRRS